MVGTLLRVQQHNGLILPVDLEVASRSIEVRATVFVKALEHEAVVPKCCLVTGCHADIPLHFVKTHQGDPRYHDGQTAVSNHHAPVTAAKLSQPGEEPLLIGQRPTQHIIHMGKDQITRQHDGHHTLPGGRLRDTGAEPARHNGSRHQRQQTLDQYAAVLALPVAENPGNQQQDQQERQRHEEAVEVRAANGNLQIHPFKKQRGDGPHQHDRHGGQQQQVIAQQECLAGQRFETGIATQGGCTCGEQRQPPTRNHHKETQDKGTAFRVIGEGMHRGQHARTHQERAQQTHGKSDNRQQHRPGAEHVALFTDRQRMDQRCPGQPGQQGGIFYRIPEPPATPTQFVIGPPGTQRDAYGQETPGHGCPGTRPSGPGRIQVAGQQTGDGKSKGDGKAYIPHIKHGRVHNQPGVLQQRIQVGAIKGKPGQGAIERVGCEQHEQQETHRNHAHHGQHPSHHHQGHTATEQPDHGAPTRQHPAPQQQRAFVPPPDGGQPIS